MKTTLQCEGLFQEVNKLHKLYGCPDLSPIYGAGCINQPKLMFLFMNPTGRNVSANPEWNGLKAPWLGTKNIWRMIYKLGFINTSQHLFIQNSQGKDWTYEFSEQLYKTLRDNGIYITNFAKCTQKDARRMGNKVFKAYLTNIKKEISLVQPKQIVAFGNQVSSILLGKRIKVGHYLNGMEIFEVNGKLFKVFPAYYPVGQGMRNMDAAINRIKNLVDNYLFRARIPRT